MKKIKYDISKKLRKKIFLKTIIHIHTLLDFSHTMDYAYQSLQIF